MRNTPVGSGAEDIGANVLSRLSPRERAARAAESKHKAAERAAARARHDKQAVILAALRLLLTRAILNAGPVPVNVNEYLVTFVNCESNHPLALGTDVGSLIDEIIRDLAPGVSGRVV